jgi:hypothetical protein
MMVILLPAFLNGRIPLEHFILNIQNNVSHYFNHTKLLGQGTGNVGTWILVAAWSFAKIDS